MGRCGVTDEPTQFYRLRCGQAIHSDWLESRDEAWSIAIDKGLAYVDEHGEGGLGPLTWIEVGEERGGRIVSKGRG